MLSMPIAEVVSESIASIKEKSFKKTKQINKKIGILIGKIGVGKSALFGCIAGCEDCQSSGWRDGTICNEPKNFLIDDFKKVDGNDLGLILFDTQGFTGNLKKDIKIINKLLKDIKKYEAQINRVFLCFSSDRFTTMDEQIISLITNFTTPEFVRLTKIIITHSPAYVLTDEFITDVHKKLNKFAIAGQEDISSKITYIDLIDFRRFEGDAKVQIDKEWAEIKSILNNEIRNSPGSISVYDVKKYHWFIEWCIIYRLEIFMFFCILLIILLTSSTMSKYNLQITLVKKIGAMENQIKEMKTEAEINVPLIPSSWIFW